MEEDKTHYKLGNTIQEFEELFGNVPINDINKIKKYLLENYIPKSKVKEKIEEYDKQRIKMEKDDIGIGFTLGKEWSDLKAKIDILQDLLEDGD